MTNEEEPSSPTHRAVKSILSSNSAACCSYLEELFRAELQKAAGPDVAKLSIALGAVEQPLTVKVEALQRWPELGELRQQVAACLEAFEGFVREMHQRLEVGGTPDARAKVKAVADAVWSKLTGSFSKDILHAQHVFNFAALLLPGASAKGKRQLDCAGVVTTTYAVCQRLAAQHGHADLAGCSMQISEDHCWLMLGSGGGDADEAGAEPGRTEPGASEPNASRLASVEVTTDTAAKRGLPASEEAWAGWLYTGGRAVLCCRRRAAAALVNSLNPSVTPGKKGQDSEQVQALQYCLLRLLWREAREAVYPAALCSLADLKEVALQDELDEALGGGDQARLDALLQRRGEDPQELFERAIAMAAGWEPLQGSAQSDAASAEPPCEVAAAATGASGEAACEAVDGAVQPADQTSADGRQPLDAAPATAATAADPEALGNSAPAPAGDSGMAGSKGQARQPGEAVPAAAAASEPPQPCPPGASSFSDPGWQWYPYSYLGGYLARRAEFLGKCASAFPRDRERYAELALGALRGALRSAAAGAAVLARYRFCPTDDQLYKDIEGGLEYTHDCLAAAAAAAVQSGAAPSKDGALSDPTLLQPVLRLWDGICLLYSGKPKPSGWVALLLKLAKLFSPEAREAAAAAEAAGFASEPMRKAAGLWGPLKPVALRPLLEAADVGAGEARPTKRPRR